MGKEEGKEMVREEKEGGFTSLGGHEKAVFGRHDLQRLLMDLNHLTTT